MGLETNVDPASSYPYTANISEIVTVKPRRSPEATRLSLFKDDNSPITPEGLTHGGNPPLSAHEHPLPGP
ncbi:hypothetical protein HYE67_004079 [Fusarium culmorum]|uniref:Uncharacterized protein n=1 Tax=Fusarium culmorum TaxID=5516 RepID=A0A2T4GL50_FUSCU|nr:hypothetical protein FCULG_00001267 [Fusarium culmorum]QPC61848.1 hypothetical protein HYE67_004079 [Fusarium culmorum]